MPPPHDEAMPVGRRNVGPAAVAYRRPVQLQPLLTIAIDVQPIRDLGEVPVGTRRVVTFRHGTFEGRDGLAGSLAPGGVDWQLVRPDGVIEIDAHYVLVTADDEAIEVRSTGLRRLSPAVADRIERGEAVEPSEYYFRTHVRLSTGSTRYRWLNDLLAVSTGERERDKVRIHVHEVL